MAPEVDRVFGVAPNPPWTLHGSSVTCWFKVPFSVVPPYIRTRWDLVDEGGVATRLRFYDVRYEAKHPGGASVSDGRMREAVVGMQARVAGRSGDITPVMWSTDNTYTQWAREFFGWPVMPGAIELSGDLWSSGSTRECDARLTYEGEQIHVHCDGLELDPDGATSSAVWFTARSIVRWPLGDSGQELLAVNPEIASPGQTYRGTSEVVFTTHQEIGWLHWLQDMADVETVATTDFEMVVGGSVDVLSG